jgi:hypothetical protein
MSCLIAHAKVHLAYKPLKCEYCAFRHFAMSKIRRHNARVHAGKPVKVSYHPITDIGSQVKDMKRKCFGAFASSTVWDRIDSGEMDSDGALVDDEPAPTELREHTPMLHSPMVDAAAAGDKQKCMMCHTLVAVNVTAMEQHASKHLNYKPYHCQYCTYDSYAREKVARHIQLMHANMASRIGYRPQPSLRARVQQLSKTSCFPTTAAAAGAHQSSPAVTVFQPATEIVESVACMLCGEKTVALEHSMDEHIQVCGSVRTSMSNAS